MNTVVSQALATGLAVITTRHSGLPEQVEDGINGFLVEEGDYQALAERILYLSEHGNLLPQLSRAARRHAKVHYDSHELIERQIEEYRKVAGDVVGGAVAMASRPAQGSAQAAASQRDA